MRVVWTLAALAGVLAGAGCATSARKAAATPPPPPKPYLRVDRAADSTLSLQVAVRQMAGPHRKAPVVWLVAVTHIGESNYFATLQQHLDRCHLVLYEGIGGKPRPSTDPDEAGQASSLQSRLARALGLAFQLDAIDYDRPHWKNSDISLDQLQRLFQEEPSPGPAAARTPPWPAWLAAAAPDGSGSAARGMDELLGIMDGSSFLGVLAHTLVQMVAASPRMQATVKVVLIETMGAIEGDIGQAQGLPPDLRELMDFLIRERNNAVLADLRQAMGRKNPPATIGIFYGAGHMHDLEARLTAELGYRPSTELWLNAFSINTRAAGLSEVELSFMRNLIQWQMRQMQGRQQE